MPTHLCNLKNLKLLAMSKFFKTVLLTGLFVGTTDILSAFINVYIFTGKFHEKMFTNIAAGALGYPGSDKWRHRSGFPGLVYPLFHCFRIYALFLPGISEAEVFSL